MQEDIKSVLVLDPGSYETRISHAKVGSSADQGAPQLVCRSVISTDTSRTPPKVFVGRLPMFHEQTDAVQIDEPICGGRVLGWPSARMLVHHVMKSAGKSESALLLTEPIIPCLRTRELWCQLFFEECNVPAMMVAPSQVLALFASGNTTGIVVDSGRDHTYAVPVVGGVVRRHAVQRIDVGGRTVTKHLQGLLRERSDMRECNEALASQVKRTRAVVPPALGQYDAKHESAFTMPDGRVVKLGDTVQRAAEGPFAPQLFGVKQTGLGEAVYRCAESYSPSDREKLYSAITLVGGNAMMPGFSERLMHDVRSVAPSDVMVAPSAVDCPLNQAAVYGGVALCSFGSFGSSFMSKTEYFEKGPAAIHSKTF